MNHSAKLNSFIALAVQIVMMVPATANGITYNVADSSGVAITGIEFKKAGSNALSVAGSSDESAILFPSVTISNTKGSSQPFVAILEIINEKHETVLSEFQNGELGPNETSEMAISWEPKDIGTFTLRSFIVTGLWHPEALTKASETKIDLKS